MHTATGQPWKLVITIEYSSAEGAHVHVVSESRFWPRSLRDDCSDPTLPIRLRWKLGDGN